MDPGSSYLLKEIQSIIDVRNLQSGEVIVTIDEDHGGNKVNIEKRIQEFFFRQKINSRPELIQPIELTKELAIASIRYGFSTKANYTKIDKEFSEQDVNSIVFPFLGLFSNPAFFTTSTRVFREELDQSDFWESGGALIMDHQRIGIIWVNDLYDTFSIKK